MPKGKMKSKYQWRSKQYLAVSFTELTPIPIIMVEMRNRTIFSRTQLAHQVVRLISLTCIDCVWNAMAHAQKPDFVFRRNGRVHLNRRGRQFSRILAAEVCASAVVMLDTPCSEVVWRVLTTHSIRQFPLHFPSRTSPCAFTFQLDSTIYMHLEADC
jgi:hypothetical protein